MKYLVVIPARGGSKGIKFKNIKLLQNLPLINYTINSFKQVKGKDLDIVVSTESNKIKNVVKKHFRDILVIDRPLELATDESRTEPSLIHAYNFMKKNYNESYGAIITAQPTSPLRTPETISESIGAFEKNLDKNDSLVSVCSTDYKLWIEKDSTIIPKNKDIKPRRQDREPIYYENGLIYITRTDSLIKTNHVYGENPAGFVTSKLESVDVDSLEDFELAELLIKSKIRG